MFFVEADLNPAINELIDRGVGPRDSLIGAVRMTGVGATGRSPLRLIITIACI
jgi:hypothetical protein